MIKRNDNLIFKLCTSIIFASFCMALSLFLTLDINIAEIISAIAFVSSMIFLKAVYYFTGKEGMNVNE
jgi:presenilin-like A22 family membrane protease